MLELQKFWCLLMVGGWIWCCFSCSAEWQLCTLYPTYQLLSPSPHVCLVYPVSALRRQRWAKERRQCQDHCERGVEWLMDQTRQPRGDCVSSDHFSPSEALSLLSLHLRFVFCKKRFLLKHVALNCTMTTMQRTPCFANRARVQASLFLPHSDCSRSVASNLSLKPFCTAPVAAS